jgi:hypothetical protein
MKWAGRVACAHKNNNTHEKKKLLGGHSRRRRNNIKVCCQEIEYESADSIQLVKETAQWSSLVNTTL